MKKTFLKRFGFAVLVVLLLGVTLEKSSSKLLHQKPPIVFDQNTRQNICPDGSIAKRQQVDSLRETRCFDCTSKYAYICGEKFWINTWGGLPGNIADEWEGPYNSKDLDKHIEPIMKLPLGIETK